MKTLTQILLCLKKIFRKLIGLEIGEFKIEMNYDPLTLQSAVDSSWF